MSLFQESNKDLIRHKEQLMRVLEKYMPAPAVAHCSELIMHYKLHLHIEVERKDRLGDYHPHLGKGNRITINHNLNPYEFLLTFIHELAHHTAYKKYGNKHQPHGKEWKEEFKILMRPVVLRKYFPPVLESAIIKYMQNPAYTHTGNLLLTKAFQPYNISTGLKLLDDLAEGAIFKIGLKGRIKLRKGQKRRTYIQCEAVETGKKYLVHAVAGVVEVST